MVESIEAAVKNGKWRGAVDKETVAAEVAVMRAEAVQGCSEYLAACAACSPLPVLRPLAGKKMVVMDLLQRLIAKPPAPPAAAPAAPRVQSPAAAAPAAPHEADAGLAASAISSSAQQATA